MTQLTLSSNAGLTFLFQVIAPAGNPKTQPSQKIPLPNKNSADQLLFRFFGQSEELSFDFVLIPSSVDLSNGTHSSTVLTVLEQHEFLRDVMYDGFFARYWKINFPSMYSTNIFGTIEVLDIQAPKSSRQNYRTGRLTFTRGKLAGVPEF